MYERWKSFVLGQELAIFPGEDVVGHCCDTEPLSKCFA